MMSFFPAKIEIKNPTHYWHIEREKNPSGFWEHHHEYNFAVEMHVMPRIKAVVTDFYINLSINNQIKKVDYQSFDGFPEITPQEKLANVPNPKVFKTYIFQLKVPNEITVPATGNIILEFNRGKVKNRVDISYNDDYGRILFSGKLRNG